MAYRVGKASYTFDELVELTEATRRYLSNCEGRICSTADEQEIIRTYMLGGIKARDIGEWISDYADTNAVDYSLHEEIKEMDEDRRKDLGFEKFPL